MKKSLRSKMMGILPAFAVLSLVGAGSATWFFGTQSAAATAAGHVEVAPYSEVGTVSLNNGNNVLNDFYIHLDQPTHTNSDGTISYDSNAVAGGSGISFYTDAQCTTALSTITVKYLWDNTEQVKNHNGLTCNWALTAAGSESTYLIWTAASATPVSLTPNGSDDADTGATGLIAVTDFGMKYVLDSIPDEISDWNSLSSAAVTIGFTLTVTVTYDINAA